MENFFIDDNFCHDLDDLIRLCTMEDDIEELADDWSIIVDEAESQKIFILDKDFVVNAISERTDRFEDRFPEDDNDDRLSTQIKKAIEQSIDLEKLNSLLPELYYPSGETFEITKKDLIEHVA